MRAHQIHRLWGFFPRAERIYWARSGIYFPLQWYVFSVVCVMIQFNVWERPHPLLPGKGSFSNHTHTCEKFRGWWHLEKMQAQIFLYDCCCLVFCFKIVYSKQRPAIHNLDSRDKVWAVMILACGKCKPKIVGWHEPFPSACIPRHLMFYLMMQRVSAYFHNLWLE